MNFENLAKVPKIQAFCKNQFQKVRKNTKRLKVLALTGKACKNQGLQQSSQLQICVLVAHVHVFSAKCVPFPKGAKDHNKHI